MYTLHIGNKNYSSWSLRPWALMVVLGIPFEEKLHVFGAGFTAKAAGSPSGKVPCLVHDGRAVWDSLAIVEYLAERHPGVWPKDEGARAWARSAAAEMHSGYFALRNHCSMTVGVRIVFGTLFMQARRSEEKSPLRSATPAPSIMVSARPNGAKPV